MSLTSKTDLKNLIVENCFNIKSYFYIDIKNKPSQSTCKTVYVITY